ncbi:class 1 fructose-bisphosphatase [Hymenobacter baengnokdamensis]|uniref:class 1 fructose-bisphosphatase n=1 Tax=Hymenobacter baengnokdamensis TaxID=2615203 RepID=UPI00124604C5|nr:class 1 fructose-bisphosphatase [Hymenobacter baengnokdamensis]
MSPSTIPPSHDDIATPVGTTLERYIMRKQAEFPFATGELSQLLRDIALASKIMAREVSRAGLNNLAEVVGAEGEQQPPRHRLGEEAHIRFVRALTNGRECCAVLSEARPDIIDTGNHEGKYVVALNPLNGSVSLDFNVNTGTIFSIYRRVSRYGGPARAEDFLQGGRAQVAAGYILYGSSTMLVYTTGHGVKGFTYEPSLGEFFLSHPHLTMPKRGEVFSCNEGNWFDFPEFARTFLTTCKERRMAARYVGSLAADYHRNLFTGGIYLYPPTGQWPSGKLRLLYECYPIAFVSEQAGGVAVTGATEVLDVPPTADLHQRVPLFVGSSELVRELQAVASK